MYVSTVGPLVTWFCTVSDWWHFMSWVCDDFLEAWWMLLPALRCLRVLCGTDGSHGPSAFTSLILWCKNTPCQSWCFYFLVGKSSCCQTWTAVEGSPSPPPHPLSGEMPFSQTVYNSAKFGPRLSPVRGGAIVVGWIWMCLSWNGPNSLNTHYHVQKCEVINVTSAALLLNLFV